MAKKEITKTKKSEEKKVKSSAVAKASVKKSVKDTTVSKSKGKKVVKSSKTKADKSKKSSTSKRKESKKLEQVTSEVVIRSELKDSLSSPQKARLVADMIRGMDVVEAESILKFTRKKAAKSMLKVLKSAAANAENNNNLDKSDLFVKTVYVNEGIKLPRYRFASRGRVVKIVKRRAHIVIELSNKR